MNEHVLGRITQTTITMEEMGELIQALGKYVRFLTGDETLRKDIYDIREMIIEELADVELCLEKFKELNYIDLYEIEKMKEYKESRLK